MNNASDRGSFTPDDISPWFWGVVAKANKSRDKLQEMLHEMNREDIIRFQNEFQEAAIQLADEPFIEYMDEGISEDGVQDVAEWVVSQGKEFYSDVWDNPENVPETVEAGDSSTFSSVADNVFWDRFNEAIPDEL